MQKDAASIAPEQARAGVREWLGLATLSVPCVLYAADLTVLYLAVPEITRQLKPTSSELLWIVDIYGFMVAGWLIAMGTLGDRIGRRQLLMIGAAAFALTSAVAAYSTSPEMLIVARAFQGIAAATLAPSTLALIRNLFVNDHERALAIGVWVAGFSAGGVLGPVLGGWILEHFWWGAVLLVNVPLMLVLMALAPFLLPESKDDHAGRIDLLSVGLSLAAALLVMYALKATAENGASLLLTACALVGAAFGVLFIRRQRQLADPLVDLALFRNQRITTALFVNLLGLFTLLGLFLFFAQYLQLVLGMGPLEAGLWTAPSGVMFIIGSMLAPYLMRYAPTNLIVAIGLVIGAIGYAALAMIDVDSGTAWIVTAMLIACAGLSPMGTIMTDLVISAAEPKRAGAAAAVSETSFEFGGAAGIAVLGSLVMAVYRARMEQLAPSGLDSQNLNMAMDTLGGAWGAAATLANGPVRDGLLMAARASFTEAFAIAAGVSAVATLASAVVAYRRLGDARVRT